MHKHHVAYFTPSRFDTLNAGVLRNLTIASAVAKEYADVVIVHSGPPIGEDVAAHIPDGVSIVAGGEPSVTSLISRIRRYRYGPVAFAPGGVLHDARAALVYNPGPAMWRRLRRATTNRGIPLLVDVTEWLDLSDAPGGKLSPFAVSYEWFMRRLPSQILAGIAVSSSLARHLSTFGANVIVVPPLHETREDIGHSENSSDRFRILVSGSALSSGGKDGLSLELLTQSLVADPALAAHFHVHISGELSPESVRHAAQLATVAEVTRHGWIGREQNLRLTRDAEGLLVLRDPRSRRLTMGFPSKVTEAVMLGTRVIANRFGDIAGVLEPGREWLPVDELSVEGLQATLLGALNSIGPGARGSKETSQRFSATVFAPTLANLIHEAERVYQGQRYGF